MEEEGGAPRRGWHQARRNPPNPNPPPLSPGKSPILWVPMPAAGWDAPAQNTVDGSSVFRQIRVPQRPVPPRCSAG